MIPFLLEHIRENYSALFPEAEAHGELVAIKAPGKTCPNGKINILVFDERAGRLLAACMFSRSPDSDTYIEREASNVRRFSEASAHLSAGEVVPRLLFDGMIEGVRVLIEEGFPGRSMQEVLAAGKPYREIYLECGDWLAELHACTSAERVKVTTGLLDQWLFAPLDKIFEKFPGLNGNDRHEIQEWTSAAGEAIKGMEVPLVGQHGDFNSHNVIVNGGRIGVIDWEDAVFDLPPFLDMNSFIISNSHQLTKNMSSAESMRRVALSKTRYREIAGEMAGRYCEALGLPPGLLIALAPAYMAHMALMYLSEHRRQEKACADWINRLVCFVRHCEVGERW